MAVTIRLTRMGAKKKPFYRIVAADSRFSRDGRFIEVLGTYDPNPNPPAIKFNRELIAGWLKKGANPTATVKSLMKRAGLSVSRSEKPGEAAAKAE
jgi:small subunit ribosomal protein S16